jgi:acyl carrier protein
MSDLRQAIRDAIYLVAPDVDPSAIPEDVDFREAAGLDSMDFLNVLTQVAAVTGIEVPEADYGAITSIERLADYLAARLPA